MSLKPGVSVQMVAKELDVHAGYLSKWRSEYKESEDIKAAESRIDAISENAKLKEENKRLKLELEILKKAAVYFASQK